MADLGETDYLEGQLLVAMPAMADKRFERSVIYLCAHSCEGAMGLVINQSAPQISFQELLDQLDLLPDDEDGPILSEHANQIVHLGGPVETKRGFVLHSADYFVEDSTLRINDEICLTATIDILRAIAAGEGPSKSLLALGYAGWAPGQLESELKDNGWLHCPANSELIFDECLAGKYPRALSSIGVDPSFLVNDAGHA